LTRRLEDGIIQIIFHEFRDVIDFMITLIQYPRGQKIPSISPFCLKLETYLKAAQVPYDNKLTVSTAKTSKKKLPVILDDQKLIEDSSFIIEHLQQKYQIDLDKDLTNEQKAVTQSFKWLCERNIVSIVMWFRWADEKNWPLFREQIFAGAPWLVKVTIANKMANKVKKDLWGMGIGRFTDAERIHILRQDLKSLSDFLGDKKFFFGEKIHTLDIIVFATLAQIEYSSVTPQLAPLLLEFPNLQKHVHKIMQTYWSDYLS